MSARGPLALPLLTAAALAISAPARPQEDARPQLEAFQRALDRAVSKVSRASLASPLATGDGCRGYRLEGYGAVFVLAPRALPIPGGRAALMLRGGPDGMDGLLRMIHERLRALDSDELHARIEQSLQELRRTQRAQEDALRAAQRELERARREEGEAGKSARAAAAEARARERELRLLERHAEEFRRQAEQARLQAERALEKALAEAGGRLAVEVAEPARAPAAPEAPLPPAPPSAPTPPEPTAPPEAEATPEPPLPAMPPAPPWSFWLEEEEDVGGSAEEVVGAVRAAVTEALEKHAAVLRALRSEEQVVVAVDFRRRGPLLAPARTERTLVVRARKSDLDAHAAGRLTAAELRRRIEYTGY